MNNNKTFFLLTNTEGTLDNNVGIKYTNVNLKNILGHIYDKYTAFNLKLESYRLDRLSGNETLGSSLLHLTGFHWINGYDTNPSYPNSRVIETLQAPYDPNVGNNAEWWLGINFLSNANCISFYRPSSFIIPEIVAFYTNADGTFYSQIIESVQASFCFSITGIDAYKIMNPSKGLVYRMYDKETSYLLLDSNDAVSIDPFDSTQLKKRIFVFKNVNLRTVIGPEIYDKYNKFNLITVRTYAETAFGLLNGSQGVNMYLSGTNLNFERGTFLPTMPTTTTYNSLNNAVILHPNYPVFVGQLIVTGLGRIFMTQNHIENVFIKPSNPVGDIVVNVGNVNNLNLHTHTSGTNAFPIFVLGFNIIPVVDA